MLTLWGYLIMGMGASGGIGMSIACRKIAQFFSPGPRHEAYFSPNGGLSAALVKVISKARKEILLQGFTFSSRTISDALCAAKKRGVHIEILLDPINEKDPTSDLSFLLDSGLDPHIDDNHGCAHNKVLIVDNRTLVTGSFNFTRQSEEENAENLLVVQGVPELIYSYREQFLNHKVHGRKAQKSGAYKQGSMGQPNNLAASIPVSRGPVPVTSVPVASPASSIPVQRPQTVPATNVPLNQPMSQPLPASVQQAPLRPATPAVQPISSPVIQSPQNIPAGTPSVAASLANMGLGAQGGLPSANPSLHPNPSLHQGHNLSAGPHIPNATPPVSTLGGTQMTPEMLRAMVQNAANARNG